MAGTGPAEAARLLDRLHGEGLLTEAGRRRYGMHDLLRRYARDRAATDPPTDNQAALDRLLGYYEHAAARAGARLNRQTRPRADPANGVLRDTENADVSGVHDADGKPGNSGGVVGEVPRYVGTVPGWRRVLGGDACQRAGGSRERRGRLSRLLAMASSRPLVSTLIRAHRLVCHSQGRRPRTHAAAEDALTTALAQPGDGVRGRPADWRRPGSWSWCARSPARRCAPSSRRPSAGAPRDATDGGAERESLRGGYASGRPPVPRGLKAAGR